MILNHKNLKINSNNIKIQRKQKYSNDFSFYPILYQKKQFIIQSPQLFIPFGIQTYSNNRKYLDLSFQNIENNKDIQSLIQNLKIFYQKINLKFPQYNIEKFIRKSNFSKWMRFKINDDCLFFDQNKKPYTKDLPKTYGIFLIHLSGLWLMNDNLWFQWHIIQSKINIPLSLKDYSFIDDKIQNKIPPPPPLPKNLSKYDKMLKIGISKEAVNQKINLDKITSEQLKNVSLKKTIIHKKNKNKKQNENEFIPSIEELRETLLKLKKIN
tara:strand:+ start:61 stop:864 length:804 start_codon:yes stop_codon:yes gene_type:complete